MLVAAHRSGPLISPKGLIFAGTRRKQELPRNGHKKTACLSGAVSAYVWGYQPRTLEVDQPAGLVKPQGR